MADSSDIYRRFVATPLRLKSRPPTPSPPQTPPSPLCARSSFTDAVTAESPAVPGRSHEVKRLRRRVAKIKICTEEEAVQSEEDKEEDTGGRSETESSAGTSPADAGTGTGTAVVQKKKKRETRAVLLTNEDTGGRFVDTPTKAKKPPKRSRKGSLDSGEKDLEIPELRLDDVAVEVQQPTQKKPVKVTVQTRPLRRSRRLQGVKLESPKLAAKSAQSTKRNGSVRTSSGAMKDAAETSGSAVLPVDWVSKCCDALLSTNTISGCFFALSFNALRAVQQTLIPTFEPSKSNPFESVFTICLGIAQCEKLAQRSFPSLSSQGKIKLVRRREGGKSVKKATKVKKSVRFRSFDLSCLNLQYVDDDQVAGMVEKILKRYGSVMEHVETILSRIDSGTDDPAKSILNALASVMANPSEVYSSIAPDGVVETDAWKKVYNHAFGGRDLYSQHEIRVCGEYFSRQFANLVSPRVSSPPQFLQRVFSSLVSSSVRFKLRELFVANEDFDENVEVRSYRVLRDEDGNQFPSMAPYEHQDLGAAIHWALQESLLYRSVVQPLCEMLEHEGIRRSEDGTLDAESSVAKYLEENAAEDLDHMEKYVLARRFLRYHITKAWRHRVDSDDGADKTWSSIEKVCSVAKRFNFEDETHLFPLASVEEFVSTLSREESTLQQMEEVLQTFYENKYGERASRCTWLESWTASLTKNSCVCAVMACMGLGMNTMQPEPCMECHHIITREENPTSIRCTSCASRFHLGCLHLPDSFAQYSEHYVCPSCFLGRGGY